MSDVSASLRELAEPWAGGERIKTVIDRAARRAGLSYWRAFDIWYGKARCVRDFEVTAIHEAIARKRKEEARNELAELRTRLLRLESLLVQTDPEFHRPSSVALREQIRALGGKRGNQNSAMD